MCFKCYQNQANGITVNEQNAYFILRLTKGHNSNKPAIHSPYFSITDSLHEGPNVVQIVSKSAKDIDIIGQNTYLIEKKTTTKNYRHDKGA